MSLEAGTITASNSRNKCVLYKDQKTNSTWQERKESGKNTYLKMYMKPHPKETGSLAVRTLVKVPESQSAWVRVAPLASASGFPLMHTLKEM